MNTSSTSEQVIAALPSKRYFTAEEVCDLCALKPHVLRDWEQKLLNMASPNHRLAPRRYYQHHEVQLLRRMRHWVYEQGFTEASVRQLLAGEHTAEADPQAAVRLSATELQNIRQELAQVKAALDRALMA